MTENVTKIEESSSHVFLTDEEKKRQRSQRVARQPRDEEGRWIAAGANVQWNAMNQVWSGTVQEIRDGKAIVRVHQDNGESYIVELEPQTLTVTTSKARLDAFDKEYTDTNNNFKAFLNETEDLENTKVTRKDGYSIEIEKDDENEFTYQIFSPDGVSLGRYAFMGETIVDEMIEDNKVERIDTPGVNPKPDEASVNVQLVRVSRDSETAIIKYGDRYKKISAATGENLAEGVSEFAPLIASGSWRRATTDEKENFSSQLKEVISEASDIVVETTETYRVPDAVKSEISKALELSNDIPEDDKKYALSLANNETVSLEEIKWIDSFFTENSVPQQLRGGYKGQKWASKIVRPQIVDDSEEIKKYEFGESLDYYAVGDDPDSSEAYGLLALNIETGTPLAWESGEFVEITDEAAGEIDRPLLLPIDSETAEALAMWIDGDNTGTFDLLEADPDERNLFDLAKSEIDYEHLGRLSTIIADATGYAKPERSADAQRQQRVQGRFRDQGGSSKSSPAKETEVESKPKKAEINAELSTEADPASRISIFLKHADPTAITAAAEPETEDAPEPEPEKETGSVSDDILYFAIVDEVDKAAVLDVVAITKAENGDAQGWTRKNGEWTEAPNILADLQGSTPPPVVELDTPEVTKDVLAQIDEHDSQAKEEPEPVAASAVSQKERDKASKKGQALPDGSYPIRNEKDLKNAIQAFGRAKDSDKAKVKKHIKKRARALNRTDLIPDNWSQASNEDVLDQNPLFGDYGEVISLTAAGAPGVADTPTDFRNVRRLKNYWKYGAGAAKINWANPNGNLTRCHRHLTKYIGSADAWGYCQNLHKELFGQSNAERDN